MEKENKALCAKIDKLKESKSEFDREFMKIKQEKLGIDNVLHNQISTVTQIN